MEFVGMKRLLKQFMYNDCMTVSRQVASLDAEGADDYRIDEIYHEIPCHLGIYAISLTGKQSDRGDVLTQKLRIDCDPQYDIRPNDILVIQTAAEQQFLLRAGKALNYPTHKEINAEREGEEA